MIEILTFGDWDIKHNGISLLETRGDQQRLLKLFKYFLTFEGRKITPERIYEDLLSDSEYYDPKNIIRTQISRLRYLFGEYTFYDIEYVAGYYIFKLREGCIVDFIEFENLINKGNYLLENSPEEAMILLERGILFYKGEYLTDLYEDDWIITTRSRYSRLYLRGLYNYLAILKGRQDYEKVIEITEKTIQYKPYEEMANAYFIEALMKTGQREYALSHYEYFTSKLYNDLKINPSHHMKAVYNRIHNYSSESQSEGYINTSNTQKTLMGRSPGLQREPNPLEEDRSIKDRLNKGCECNGEKSCNLDYFYLLYNENSIGENRSSEKANHLVLISLMLKTDSLINKVDIEQSIETLRRVINNKLRKEDVFFQCEGGPILLLLNGISYYDVTRIMERIQKWFAKDVTNKRIVLEIKSQSL